MEMGCRVTMCMQEAGGPGQTDLQAVMQGMSKALSDSHYPGWHLAPVTGLLFQGKRVL